MKKIRIGVVGAGKIATFFHLPILETMEDVKIAFVADLQNPNTVARSYRTDGLVIDEGIANLPDCDIVLLAIPVAARESYIREYSRRGAYIFSEKPFATSVAQHESWLALTNRITSNYHRRLYGPIEQVKRLVESEILGELREVRVQEGGIVGKTGKSSDSYQNDPRLSGGGVIIEWGCHTFSQLTHIFEQHTATLLRADVEYQDGFDVDLRATWRLSSNDNEYGLTYDLSVVRPLKTGVDLVFDQARVSFDHSSPAAQLVISNAGANVRKECIKFLLQPDLDGVASNYHAFYKKWRHFIEQARARTALDSAWETSLATTQWIDNIYTATRQTQNGGVQ